MLDCAGVILALISKGRFATQTGANDSEMMKSVTASSASRRLLTGLLGAPIAHSASPAMHERAAEALGFRCHYQLIEVAGAGREELKVLLEGVRRLGFAGINLSLIHI